MLRLLVIFILLMCTLTVRAEFYNGKQLQQWCEAAGEEGNNQPGIACIGYITGVMDAHGTYGTANLLRPLWCNPEEGISTEEAVDIVMNYLRQNPGELENPASLLVSRAFAGAYPQPCN